MVVKKYPWDEWDRGVWRVTRGDDFVTTRASFIHTLYQHGKSRGLKMRYRSPNPNIIIFEFYDGGGR